MKILVQVCCSVDSHYFFERLKKDFSDAKIVAFFYDPNIHPYSEYKLRFLDVEYSCKKLGIELVEGEYDYEHWLNSVKGYEDEPEKGERCTICYEKRLLKTIQKAKEFNFTHFTTTLLMSPKKSQEKLQKIGLKLEKEYGIEFIFKDYRAKNGMHEQNQATKENNLYRQDYCGCIFGLTKQREYQNILMDEMICSINKQIVPASIEERIELYKKRNELAKENKDFKIVKKRFLNYRNLLSFVRYKNSVIPSYFLPYSTIKNKKSKGKIEFCLDNIYYFNRNEIKFITIDFFNKLANTNYESVANLYFNPPSFEKELIVREKIVDNFDLSAIIVLDEIIEKNLEIYLNSVIYNDIKDQIIII